MASFFDLSKGMADILSNVKGLLADGTENVDGTDTYRLKGSVPATALKSLTSEVTATGDISTTLWIGAALAVSNFGRLDIIFNNVGVPTPRPGLIFEEHTDRRLRPALRHQRQGRVHRFASTRSSSSRQQGDGGVILNTGSVAGLVSWGGSVYGSTKGAVHQLTKAAAIEGAPFGIRCNAICPAGMPYTNFTNAMGMAVSDEDKEQMARGRRLDAPARQADPAEDCAEAAVYLVSDAAKNVTGALLPVDGGYVAR